MEGGHLDIVSQTSLAVDPLAGLVAGFLRDHPRVAVRISDPDRSTVEHLVRTGQSELGLLNSTPAAADLDGVDLREQELQLVLPPGTRAGTAGRPVTHEELAALEFVTTPAGTSTRELLEDTVRGAGARPRVAVETAHRAMLSPLVLVGAGAALLPRTMAEDAAAKGAVVCEVEPALRVRARLVWRRGPLSPAADRFVRRLGGDVRNAEPESGTAQESR
nr:LysR family transcriptional regulator substrate-binding protein [Pseudonocardia sp. C8]